MMVPDFPDHIFDVLKINEGIIMLPELGHTIGKHDDHIVITDFYFLLFIPCMIFDAEDNAFRIDLFEFISFVAV